MSTKQKKKSRGQVSQGSRTPAFGAEAPPEVQEWWALYTLALQSTHNCPWSDHFRKTGNRASGKRPKEWDKYADK